MTQSALERARSFCADYGLQVPILMAPMAGACPPQLSAAVADAGGMGACGALLLDSAGIKDWVDEVRASSNGAFQINLWIPDPAPNRDKAHEDAVRHFLGDWGPEVPEDAAEPNLINFEEQCDALLAAGPAVISSIMGLYDPEFVEKMKDRNIRWFATVTTVEEALRAQEAGADVVIAQGMEAGGHRGAFNAQEASSALVGLFSLLPAVVDAVDIPVVATGGIGDARGTAAALVLGASAVQIGTGLLRTNEANIASAWADAIGAARPEDTIATRAFSGRLGRSIKTSYAVAAADKDAPDPAPYPIQRSLTQNMRAEAAKSNSIETMQAWAGQSSRLAKTGSASVLVQDLWEEAAALLQ